MVIASRWQWQRYLYKTELVQSYQTNSQSLPEALPPVADETKLEEFIHRKVYLDGEYDFEHQIIIMNQRHRTGPGYWLVTPFKPPGSGTYFLVSRGFIPYADATPESWKKYEFAKAERIEAVVQEAIGHRSALSPDSFFGNTTDNFPRKWLYPDLEKIAKVLPYPVHSGIFLQRLGSPPIGEFPAESVSIRVPPSTHFGYSIEWALLAFSSLTVGFLLQAFPRNKKRKIPTAERHQAAALLALCFALLPLSASATDKPQDVPQEAQVIEHLGEKVSLDVPFTDEEGKTVTLGDFVASGKPIILAPVYFECPRLCTLTQEGLTEGLKTMPLKFNEEFRVVSLSFNSTETPEFAKKKAATYRGLLSGKAGVEDGWKFLTGNQDNIKKIMSEIGFVFAPDAGEFLHPAVLMVLTPDGRISRYLYGIRYLPQDLKLALVEASDGKIGTVMDRILIYCFRYDHKEGRYTLVIMRVIQVVCSGIFLFLMSCLIGLRMKEKSRQVPALKS